MKVSDLKSILNNMELQSESIPLKVKVNLADGRYTVKNVVSFKQYSDCIVLNLEED